MGVPLRAMLLIYGLEFLDYNLEEVSKIGRQKNTPLEKAVVIIQLFTSVNDALATCKARVAQQKAIQEQESFYTSQDNWISTFGEGQQ